MFRKVSGSESIKCQNRPVRKRKKPAKLIDAASSLDLSSDDEKSTFAAESIIKKSKGDKKGLIFFSFSTYGHSVLFLTEQVRVPIFFFWSVMFLNKLIDIFFKISKHFIFQQIWAFCPVLN